jgi:hypothetical protein
MTQQEIIEHFKKLSYKTYEKFGKFNFEVSQDVQEVVTSIDGEVETTNIAHVGNLIITGIKDEKYVLTLAQFIQNYEIEEFYHPEMKGIARVKPQPRFAVQWNLEDQLIFIAPWGEKMICNEGDYLVAFQDFSEVYRIEKSVFEQTYKLVN